MSPTHWWMPAATRHRDTSGRARVRGKRSSEHSAPRTPRTQPPQTQQQQTSNPPQSGAGANENRDDQPMNRPTTRPLRVSVALLLAVAAMLPAACGGSTPTGSTPSGSATTHQARLDPALHDLLPQSVKDRGALRVGTEASYAPIESYAPDGRTIIGMDPDLGVEMGRVLGVRIQL